MKNSKQELEAMSDFEINLLVAKHDKKGFINKITTPTLLAKGKIDYCNNPSDMMPLVFKASISLLTHGDTWCCFDWENDSNESWHKNPLRACAIVYMLIIQGNSND